MLLSQLSQVIADITTNGLSREALPPTRRTGKGSLLPCQDDYPHHCEDNPAKQVGEPENLAISLGISCAKGVGDCLLHN